MQVQDNVRGEAAKYRNSWHTLTSVARTEGLAGLYRGFFAAVLVYAPLVGMHFMLYEQLKRFAASRLGVSSDKLPHVVYLCAAGLSSSTAALVTTPLDVVKTRLQVQSATEGGYVAPPRARLPRLAPLAADACSQVLGHPARDALHGCGGGRARVLPRRLRTHVVAGSECGVWHALLCALVSVPLLPVTHSHALTDETFKRYVTKVLE